MLTQVAYPNAPATTALKGTLLDVATVTDDFTWHTGIALFDSYNCMEFKSAATFCGANAKDFENTAGWVDGFRFATYGGVLCKAIGLDEAKMLSEAERVFTNGESTAVEAALMSIRFADGATSWSAPEDITPAGGAVSVQQGIALLEGFAGSNYVGAPTLHLPRSVASLGLSDRALDWSGNSLMTRLGSKVAAGVGYDFPNLLPSGDPAATGTKAIYVTGEVFVGRSAPVFRQSMNYETNEVFVLAERGYIAAVDCFAACIRVVVGA